MGMNHRNAQCIQDQNPRRLFPCVDTKSKMHALCKQIGVPTPELYAVIAAHSALRHLPRLLQARPDFVLKPDRLDTWRPSQGGSHRSHGPAQFD